VKSPTSLSVPTSTSSLSAPQFAKKILLRGLRANLGEAAIAKLSRLFRHHRRVIRVRIDLDQEHANNCRSQFIAAGRIEISGPDLVARVKSDGPLKSLDLLVDKLDRMLRERTKTRANRRNNRPAGTEFRDLIAPPADFSAVS
jgi:putative sigma-54 modulation protein